MNPFDSTIAALSTPPGKGGVALIRVSGADAIAITERCFSAQSGKRLAEHPSRTAVYGHFLSEGEPIDDVLVTLFRAPASYTGEDTAEICCHGSMLVCQAVLAALFAAGAQPAAPGEFTRRAHMAGKLSLSEAEAIGELLDAKNYEELRLYERDARSRLSSALSGMYDALLTVVSSVYAKIDYPDEDMAELSDEEIAARVLAVLTECRRLLATYRTGRAITEGIPTVLLGKPNTGKSSLYNLLAGREAAIVTDVAGTTRDVLETTAVTGRVTLRLYDTAGVRESDDLVERIGVDRTKEEAAKAELLLLMLDGSQPADEEDRALLSFLDTLSATKIAILNKRDLGERFDTAILTGRVSHILPFSAKEGDLSALSALINRFFTDESIRAGEDVILSSARQYAALRRAEEHLSTAITALQAGMATDAAISDLELALGDLGEVDGRRVGEDVVASIFSKFCVGK